LKASTPPFYAILTFLKSSSINGMIAFVGGVASIGPLYPIASVKYGKAPQ
jgi:hypothetical protein